MNLRVGIEREKRKKLSCNTKNTYCEVNDGVKIDAFV